MATILVVDDYPVNRQLLAAILRPHGHTLLEAGDGVEALDLVQRTRPDLIILDMSMPRMGGVGFLEARRQFASLTTIPVILYTATHRKDEAQALARDPAVVSVITKPANPEVLAATVSSILRLPFSPLPISQDYRSANALLASVVELISDMVSEHDAEHLLAMFCRASRAIIPAGRAALVLHTPEHRVCLDGENVDEIAMKNLVPLIAAAEDQQKPRRFDRQSGELHALPIRSALALPVASRTTAFGMLLLLNRESADEFSADDERLAMTLATQLALVYGNLVAHRRLEKRLEMRGEELRRSREELTGIFEAAPVAIIALDEEDRVRAWNRAAESMFGWRASEIIGRPSPTIPADKREEFESLVRSTAGGTIQSIETTRLRRNGDWIDVSLSGAPLRDASGHSRGKIAVLTDITQRKADERELLKSHEELRALSHRLIKLEEEERTRVARELHDQLGQLLTAIKMEVAQLPQSSRPHLLELVDKTIDTTVNIVRQLRPTDVDQLGLSGAIEKAARNFQERSGIGCDLSIHPSDFHLEESRAIALYRIFEEALTNIARHAQATHVDIRLRQYAKEVILEVRDDGRGITGEEIASPDAFGLIGMRERVVAFAGRLEIQNIAGSGTFVTAALPVEP